MASGQGFQKNLVQLGDEGYGTCRETQMTTFQDVLSDLNLHGPSLLGGIREKSIVLLEKYQINVWVIMLLGKSFPILMYKLWSQFIRIIILH